MKLEQEQLKAKHDNKREQEKVNKAIQEEEKQTNQNLNNTVNSDQNYNFHKTLVEKLNSTPTRN